MAIWQFDLFMVCAENALPVLAEDGWTLPQWPAASTLRAHDVSATNAKLDAICGFALALHARYFDPATTTLLHPDRNPLAAALAGFRAAAFARSA